MREELDIQSPKRSSRARSGWEGFFPYYAGYSETFARALLQSARLSSDAVVLDPWNGSGTTTYTAARLGIKSLGSDLNPVMVVIARARLLPPSEADSIEPLGRELVNFVKSDYRLIDGEEPLSPWFTDETTATVRVIEQGIRRLLIGTRTLTSSGPELDHISGLAATFYVALFAVCREHAAPFRCSNPTWLRWPRDCDSRVRVAPHVIQRSFLANLESMSRALANRQDLLTDEIIGASDVRLADTATMGLPAESFDLILTSPPYCTRIDYTAATRIELALLDGLVGTTPKELSLKMIGSVRVPPQGIEVSPLWGQRCRQFLDEIRKHPSKASSGYYYKTHLDYFDKMSRSLRNLARSLKKDGTAVFVVQDSYYKNIHNDLPVITTEIAEAHGLRMWRRDEFHNSRSMSGINVYTRKYNRPPGSIEAVLCFSKQ